VGGRNRAGLALAVLALATLGATVLPWQRACHQGICVDVTSWSRAIGTGFGLFAAALLVCEALPLLGLGADRPLLGGALGLAVAVSIGLLVGFELASVDEYGGLTFWIGSWAGIVLAVLLVLASVARLRGLPRERPEPEWLDALLVGGAGLAFASAFMPWAVATHALGGPTVDAGVGLGGPALVFALAALAVVGAEAFYLAGLRPVVPATVVLAGLTAVFGLLSVISIARQLGKYADLGHGAWVALAACAALVIGGVIRTRDLGSGRSL
jgi:hypothetical protein